MPDTLFISDLHLDTERPHITRLFGEFLNTLIGRADALYILGDLFEHWIGDDAPDVVATDVIKAIKNVTDNGLRVYFLHGNRDFLIGKKFAAETGCVLLPEAVVIDLYGTPTLIMHGDTLCTDDVGYQNFRKKTNNKLLQKLVLTLPVKTRQSLAAYLRKRSIQDTRDKADDIMDVNSQAVIDAMRQYQVQRLIHGHTHRPARHELLLDGQAAERFVLGDWYEQGSVLRCTPEGCELRSLA